MNKPFRTNRHDGKHLQKASLIKLTYYPNREQTYWLGASEIVDYENPEDVINEIEDVVGRLLTRVKRDALRKRHNFNPQRKYVSADYGIAADSYKDEVIEGEYET